MNSVETRHPFCSRGYASALASDGVEVRAVPEWGTHVLVRSTPGTDMRHATGVLPVASISPKADVEAGCRAILDSGVQTISLVTDPLFRPDVEVLARAFDLFRPLRTFYYVDRELGRVRIRKRHRNRANGARRLCEIARVDLAEHLADWGELYDQHVEGRGIARPLSSSFFERVASSPEITTFAVYEGEAIVAMSIWVEAGECVYMHESVASDRGREVFAAHLEYSHALEHFKGARYLGFGGSAGMIDDPSGGLVEFKRGFSNASAPAHVCHRGRRGKSSR